MRARESKLWRNLWTNSFDNIKRQFKDSHYGSSRRGVVQGRGRWFCDDSTKALVIKRVRWREGDQKLCKIVWRHLWTTPKNDRDVDEEILKSNQHCDKVTKRINNNNNNIQTAVIPRFVTQLLWQIFWLSFLTSLKFKIFIYNLVKFKKRSHDN